MKETKRIESFDLLRGISLIFIILFHSSIYNFANIHLFDFDNPPIVIILMSFMALWGGIFIIYSSVLNTLMLASRTGVEPAMDNFRHLIIAGITYLLCHYLLNLFLGRWSIDFVNNQPDLTLVAYFLRNWSFAVPYLSKLLEGSSLSTIAINLIVLTIISFFLFRNGGLQKDKRNYMILGFSGTAIMLLSFTRVSLYSALLSAIETKNYLSAILLSPVLANPYPLLPYLAYGLFGLMMGLMIFKKQQHLLKKVILPAGLIFLFFGLAGMTQFDKTISKPDYFWYFKTHFELGFFMLIMLLFVLWLKPGNILLRNFTAIRWFSRVSLTIYLLETTSSEILRIFGLSIFPAWNQTIRGCMWFGAINIVFWVIVLFFWNKVNFKYSLEYFWVLLMRQIGKQSTKLDRFH